MTATGTIDSDSCICGTALNERDTTFAVSHGNRVRIYSSSELYLLHEFSSIHGRILSMHHTTFCDAIVTLETDIRIDDDTGNGGDDCDCYLCVYHDWRTTFAEEQHTTRTSKMVVRAYTLPLAIDDPRTVCLSVCSFTGRVALATRASVGVNLWQTSNGFFEHVLEVKVNMDIAHVAVHGAYISVASETEVRVMEMCIDTGATSSSEKTAAAHHGIQKTALTSRKNMEHPKKKELIYNTLEKEHVPMIRIPSLSLDHHHSANCHELPQPPYVRHDPPPHQPVRVMGKDEAQFEAYNLAGLVKDSDVRVNAAMNYAHGNVKVLLQRFVPPNHAIMTLRFLPETITHGLQSRSYIRLLVGTRTEAFLYYFLTGHVDTTREEMSKKVLVIVKDRRKGTSSRLILK
jgi:hypothetical protein